jgi:hypothetical protein
MPTNLTNIEKQKILKHIEFWDSAKEAAKVVLGGMLIIAMICLFIEANINYFNTNQTNLTITFFFEFGLTLITEGICALSIYMLTKSKEAAAATVAAAALVVAVVAATVAEAALVVAATVAAVVAVAVAAVIAAVVAVAVIVLISEE